MAYDESYEQYLKAWNQKQSLRGRPEPRVLCEVCEEREALADIQLDWTDELEGKPFPVCESCLDGRPENTKIVMKEHKP